MYSTAPDAGSAALSNAIGGLLAGGLIVILVYLFCIFFAWCFFYLVIKAAVRNGTIEAHKKMGTMSGGSGYINGWPPSQEVGPPAAPVYQGGYRGPNG